MSGGTFIGLNARVLSAVGCLLLPTGDGHAQSFNVTGTSGYLSEWQLSGQIAASPERGGRSLTGVVVMKHTGLCSQDGPVEKTAEFRARIVGSRPSSRIDGVVVLDGAVCTFGGPLPGRFSGAMDCPAAKGIPVTFTIE
jgi:hypothetical protein